MAEVATGAAIAVGFGGIIDRVRVHQHADLSHLSNEEINSNDSTTPETITTTGHNISTNTLPDTPIDTTVPSATSSSTAQCDVYGCEDVLCPVHSPSSQLQPPVQTSNDSPIASGSGIGFTEPATVDTRERSTSELGLVARMKLSLGLAGEEELQKQQQQQALLFKHPQSTI